MTILKRPLAQSAKGSLAENEDWWRLCYETDNREFYIEHEWHHMNPYKLDEEARAGEQTMDVDGYSGPGADRVEALMAELLAEAGHDT